MPVSFGRVIVLFDADGVAKTSLFVIALAVTCRFARRHMAAAIFSAGSFRRPSSAGTDVH